MFDYLIVNGMVIDGTGRAGFRADIAIAGERIARIGDLAGQPARHVVDAAGCAVSPGFVDVHNHDEAWLLKDPHFSVKTVQGFTSKVLLSDGVSYAPLTAEVAPEIIRYWRAINGLEPREYTGWSTIAEFMSRLDRRMPVNAVPLVPYANLRAIANGWTASRPDAAAFVRIAELLEQGVGDGAAGLSTGMDYVCQCFASTDELVEACRLLRPSGGLHVMHIRYAIGRLEALTEAVEISRRSGVPLHVSHLMGRTQAESDALLGYIDRVAVNEVDFSFDSIPFCSSSTVLLAQLPIDAWSDGPSAALARMRDPALRQRLADNLAKLNLDAYHIAYIPGGRHDHLFGRTLAGYIADRNEPPEQAVLGLLAETDLAVLMVYRYAEGDSPSWPFLAHRRGMLGSDGIWFPAGQIHPRTCGSPGRILGDLVRRGLFTIEQAVHLMTARPADRFGLVNRGRVSEGCFADVVVFNPGTVRGCATYDNPRAVNEGIDHVWVNGCPVVFAGQPQRPTPGPGRSLRYRRTPDREN